MEFIQIPPEIRHASDGGIEVTEFEDKIMKEGELKRKIMEGISNGSI